MLKKRQLLYGLATFVPGVTKLAGKGAGSSDSARYCYSVWLRHLVMARKNHFKTDPQAVAELGPGSSLGIAVAALLSGAEKCYAFDVVAHARTQKNLAVFENLVSLFRRREPIPDEAEMPSVKPLLGCYGFPSHVLSDERLQAALEPSRVDRIRDSLAHPLRPGSMVQYRAPWFSPDVLEPGAVDMIFSQAVLEHIEDLPAAYRAMRLWLKPGGLVSHQVDFRCHNTATFWNGHWTYSDRMWKLIRGRRPYLLNREPHSRHVSLLAEEGFADLATIRTEEKSAVTRSDLAPRFRGMPDSDLTTSDAFMQAMRI